jgi:hypothetical protein
MDQCNLKKKSKQWAEQWHMGMNPKTKNKENMAARLAKLRATQANAIAAKSQGLQEIPEIKCRKALKAKSVPALVSKGRIICPITS